MLYQWWTPAEDMRLKTLLRDGRSFAECVPILGRTQKAIKARIKHIGRYKQPNSNGRQPIEYDRYAASKEDFIDQDNAFQAAMKKAIETGLEHTPIGVRVDTRPLYLVPVRIHPTAQVSHSGSPAALCAAVGRGNSGPAK
jgi:hypothetical protein